MSISCIYKIRATTALGQHFIHAICMNKRSIYISRKITNFWEKEGNIIAIGKYKPIKTNKTNKKSIKNNT